MCIRDRVIGLINALLIAKANANPFVVTLSTMFVGQSIERLSTQGGLPIYLYNTSTNFTNFTNIYRGEIIGIPNPILIFIILTIVYYIFLNKTTYGRKFYASGTGIKAARIVGIKVRLYHGLAYLFSALSCVVAGIILASKINSGQPLVGEVYLWDAIGAGYLSTLISKTHRANIFGTVLGILFFGIVSNGLTLIGVEFYWKEFFKGILIMLILLFSAMQKRYQTV